jgi:hypothetical protein
MFRKLGLAIGATAGGVGVVLYNAVPWPGFPRPFR